MNNAKRRRVARVVIPLMLLPLAPFWWTAAGAKALHEWIEAWQWPERWLRLIDRVHLWSLQ